MKLALIGLLALTLTVICDRLLMRVLRKSTGLEKLGVPSRILIQTLIRVALYAIAAMIFLDSAGISITPILASLGVGSLAVALALQDTLSNFFSGVYLLIDQPVRVGDWVSIEGGIEGKVKAIGWRSTRIELMANNMVTIPNSKIASSVITNYQDPSPELPVIVGVGVSYGSDLSKVERVVIETARRVCQNAELAITDWQPLVRFHTFGDSSINLNVIVRARSFETQFALKSELLKAIHLAFKTEAIEIPFPQRVVKLDR